MGSGKEENGTIEIKIKDWKKRVEIITLKICTQDSSIIKRQLLCKIKLPFFFYLAKCFLELVHCLYLLTVFIYWLL